MYKRQVSALRKVIPDKVRLPAYITIIAAFVTVLMMAVKAFLPELNTSLGVYLPLIVVNCIILGRAEMFASKHGVVDLSLIHILWACPHWIFGTPTCAMTPRRWTS